MHSHKTAGVKLSEVHGARKTIAIHSAYRKTKIPDTRETDR